MSTEIKCPSCGTVFEPTEAIRDQAMAVAAQQFATQLEARVRAHPEYWYHFYRYWDAQRDAYDQLT